MISSTKPFNIEAFGANRTVRRRNVKAVKSQEFESTSLAGHFLKERSFLMDGEIKFSPRS
jgi:hypothetical protein